MSVYLILGAFLLIVLVGILFWALFSFIAPLLKYLLLLLVIVVLVLLIIFILNNIFDLEILNGFLDLQYALF